MSTIGEGRVIDNRRHSPEEGLRLSLYSNMHQAGADPSSFLDALAAAVERRIWIKLGVSFREFIEAPYPQGIGATMGLVDRLIGLPHRHEKHSQEHRDKMAAMRHAVRQLLAEGEPEARPHGTNRYSRVDISTLEDDSKGGTGRAYRLGRLKRDHPGLAALVVSGELSVNAAWLEAGLDKKRGRPLVRLRYAWAAASDEERAAFLAEVAAREEE